jgi:hypothetical protein
MRVLRLSDPVGIGAEDVTPQVFSQIHTNFGCCGCDLHARGHDCMVNMSRNGDTVSVKYDPRTKEVALMMPAKLKTKKEDF